MPVLILSGGEPLLRPDIFEISTRAKEMGFYLGLSSNGTLIDDAMSRRIGAIGYDYVGHQPGRHRCRARRFPAPAGRLRCGDARHAAVP